LFASFLRLRRLDAHTPRIFRVPGGRLLIALMTGSGLLFVLSALLLFIFPQLLDAQIDWHTSAPLLIGLLLTLGIGEWLVSRSLATPSAQQLNAQAN
jgi:glutamate:GABA antiporter